MVEYLLGNYLVETGRITGEQLKQVIAKQDAVRVKMGLLAVSEGLMTVEQADAVNRLQATMDKRFGDIAVEKGYLTEEQIGNLLKKQGNAYMAFAQALVNEGLLELNELEDVVDSFRQKNGFTKSEIEDLKSDDPDRLVPLFLPPEALGFQELASILIKTLIRCVDRHIYMGKASVQEAITVQEGAFQKMVAFSAPVSGYKELEVGMAEVNGGLAAIATAFCKEDSLVKEDVLDASGEFLNCVNGLYATALSRKGIDSELVPPILMESATTLKVPEIWSIPVFYGEKEAVFMIVGRK